MGNTHSQKARKAVRYLALLLLPLLFMFGCGPTKKTIKVAATSVPHAEMLEVIKPEMEKRGYSLEILVMDDYQLPNRLLDEGHLDANFFQHLPFLEKEIEEFGYKLTAIAKVHIEPLGLYSKKLSTLEEFPSDAVISIPSDPTNEARALHLLERAQLITLKEGASFYATVLDLKENPFNLKIKEIDAPLLSRTLSDVDVAIIPGNFAILAELVTDKKPLLVEGRDSPYVNVLVVQKGEENREDLRLLASLLTSEKIKQFINKKYPDKIIPFQPCKMD